MRAAEGTVFRREEEALQVCELDAHHQCPAGAGAQEG